MFATIKTKKMMCPLIGTLFVLCSFLLLGCTANKLSDQDKKWLTNEIEMGALESKNTQITDENTELKKKNKELKEHVSQLEKENTELKKKSKELEEHVSQLTDKNTELKKKNKDIEERGASQEETLPSSLRSSVSFGGKLNVGDKLTFNDKVDGSLGISWIDGKENMISNTKYDHRIIYFKTYGASVELKNGTRYICASPTGCIVNWDNFIIVEGTIEVYYKKISE